MFALFVVYDQGLEWWFHCDMLGTNVVGETAIAVVNGDGVAVTPKNWTNVLNCSGKM